MRWQRCPWGPKQDHRKHFQIGCMTSSSETDKDLFQFDHTAKVIEDIKRELEGLGERDLSEEQREAQANMLREHKKVYDNSKR